MAPEYLCELVSIRKSSENGHILLQVPVPNGIYAFSVAASKFVE